MIEKIAQNLGFTPSTLFLDFSKDILTQVFLLPDQVQTDRALEFILGLMPTPSGGSINAQTLARSCIIELLGTFVFMLGSEEPKKVQEVRLLSSLHITRIIIQDQAMRALNRLESILPSSKGRKKLLASDGVVNFLKSHILGLISYLVDKLQGVQGRETIASKQQTLRGLGALISHVGADISIVAPQVCETLKVILT